MPSSDDRVMAKGMVFGARDYVTVVAAMEKLTSDFAGTPVDWGFKPKPPAPRPF